MSETNVGASSTPQDGVLYDPAGNRIAGGVRPNPRDEPLVRFIPIPTTILALGLGYLIAKTI